DLLERVASVFVPADAVAGRFALDHDLALRRLDRAGAVLPTSATVVFERLRDAAHPRFKEVIRLVRERAENARRQESEGKPACGGPSRRRTPSPARSAPPAWPAWRRASSTWSSRASAWWSAQPASSATGSWRWPAGPAPRSPGWSAPGARSSTSIKSATR